MKLPFVSRERFDEARERIAVLENERQHLFDRILLLSGQRPIFGEVPVAVAAEAPDLTNMQPVPGKPTLASIRALADKTAMQKAHKGESIVAELKQAEMRAFQDAQRARKDAHAAG